MAKPTNIIFHLFCSYCVYSGLRCGSRLTDGCFLRMKHKCEIIQKCWSIKDYLHNMHRFDKQSWMWIYCKKLCHFMDSGFEEMNEFFFFFLEWCFEKEKVVKKWPRILEESIELIIFGYSLNRRLMIILSAYYFKILCIAKKPLTSPKIPFKFFEQLLITLRPFIACTQSWLIHVHIRLMAWTVR